MNEEKIRKWAKSKNVSDGIVTVLVSQLNKLPAVEANKLIDEIVDGNLELMAALAKIRQALAAVASSADAGKPAGGLQLPSGDEKKPSAPGTPPSESAKPGAANLQERLAALRAQNGKPPAGGKGGTIPFFDKSRPGGGLPPGKGKKKANKLPLIIGVVVGLVILLLALWLVPTFLSSRNNSFSGASAPAKVDQGLTEMPVQSKSEWAAGAVDSAVKDDFLSKPTGLVDFVTDTSWSWLLYVFGVPLILALVVSERIKARESSDVMLATLGLVVMTVAVLVAEPLAAWSASAGWPEAGMLYLIVSFGLILNLVFQFGAAVTGFRDYSVVAMGIYCAGLLIRWWFPSHEVLSVIGPMLMIVGMGVQLLEIRRGGKFGLSVGGSLLSLLVFSLVYVGIFALIQNVVANYSIPQDVSLQAQAALTLAILTKGQMMISLVVGVAVTTLVGLGYGAVALQPTTAPGVRKDEAGPLQNLNFLDSDSQMLFLQVLFFCLPWIWVLPQIVQFVMSL